MKTISHFVISVFDLIEAEGRDLRAAARTEASAVHTAIVNLVMGMVFLLVSVPLFVAAIWLMAAGLMWWLESQVSRPLAAALTGAAMLAIAASCLLLFRTLTQKRRP